MKKNWARKTKVRGGGRRGHSGVYTSTQPSREQWSDISNRILYGTAEWRMVRLQQLNDGVNMPDDLLSAHAAENHDELASLWRVLAAQFERAVLNRDAKWFERQAAAIQWRDSRTESQKALARFKAEVVLRLETEFYSRRTKRTAEHLKWWKQAKQTGDLLLKHLSASEAVHFRLVSEQRRPRVESATLTPAGKKIDARARQVLESFHPRKDAEPLTFTPQLKRKIRELEQMHRKAVVEDIIGQPYKRDENGELVAVRDEGGALVVEWKEGTQKFSHRFKNERSALDAVRDVIGLLQLDVADT